MKHLRWLAIIAFFCLLPAMLIKSGTEIYFHYIEEERFEDAYHRQGSFLKELRTRIALRTDRHRICGDIQAEVNALPEKTADGLKEILQRYNDRWPGLIRLMVFNQNYQPVTEDPGKGQGRYLWTQLARYLVDVNVQGRSSLPAGKMKMLGKIIGEWQKPDSIAFRKGDFSEITNEGRRSDLYWSQLFFQKGAEKPDGVLIILVDQLHFRNFFPTETVVQAADKLAQASGTQLKMTDTRDKGLEKWFHQEAPGLTVSTTYRSLTRLRTEDKLYTILPVEEVRGIALIALTERIRCYPERAQLEWWINFGLLLLLIIALPGSFLIHYGFIEVFISARTQLIALFLLGSLLPLSAIYYLGFQYIRANQTVVTQRKYEQIKEKVLSADEAAIAMRNQLAAFSARVKDLPEMKNLELVKLKSMFEEYRQRRMIDTYYLFNDSGEVLVTENQVKMQNEFSAKFAKGIAMAVMTYYNSGTWDHKREYTEKDSLADALTQLIFDRRSGALSAVFRDWGRIYSMDFFGQEYHFYLDIIPDESGRAKGALLFFFKMDPVFQDILREIVDTNDKNPQEPVRLFTCPVDKIYAHAQQPRPFASEVQTFALKIALEKSDQQDLLDMNGERMLAWGTLLKEIDEYMLIGLLPQAEVVRIFDRNVRLFVRLFVLSIVIVFFLAWIIARRFLGPIRSLQNGVEAIAGGNLDFRMKIDSRDEFGNLSRTFNHMAGSLKESLLQLEISNQNLARSNQALDKRLTELQVLYDISQKLHLITDVDDMIGQILDRVNEVLGAHHCSILLLDKDKNVLTLKIMRGMTLPEGTEVRLQPDEGIAGIAMRENRVVLVDHADQDERWKPLPGEVDHHRVSSLLCAPLVIGQTPVGVINVVDRISGEGPFIDDDRHLLESIASQLSLTLENFFLQQELLEKERMARELEIASSIQASFFPQSRPEVEGWSFDFHNTPAKEVGGDYYDWFDLGNGRLSFNIADVSGKGVPAALVMMMVRSSLRVEVKREDSPAAVSMAVNSQMADIIEQDRFVTFQYGCLDTVNGGFRFANAGHNYPVLYHAAENHVEEVELNGLMLGVLEEIEYDEVEVNLAPGDVLVLYTDGVTEAQSKEGKLFDEERLKETVQKAAGGNATQVREAILDAVLNFAAGAPQYDDITLVVVKRESVPADPAASMEAARA